MSLESELRLFVALKIPSAVRKALAAVSRELRRRCPDSSCKWVQPDGMHLTLKFLGGVDGGRLGAVHDALTAAAVCGQSFRLRPGAAGTFGGPARVRVVWLGLQGDLDAASALAREVDAALEPVGFPPERRPFRLHLTLARVRSRAGTDERRRIAAAVEALESPRLESFGVGEMVLMRSHLEPAGARYETLERFRLGQA